MWSSGLLKATWSFAEQGCAETCLRPARACGVRRPAAPGDSASASAHPAVSVTLTQFHKCLEIKVDPVLTT